MAGWKCKDVVAFAVLRCLPKMLPRMKCQNNSWCLPWPKICFGGCQECRTGSALCDPTVTRVLDKALKGLNRLRGARENPHFPKAQQCTVITVIHELNFGLLQARTVSSEDFRRMQLRGIPAF